MADLTFERFRTINEARCRGAFRHDPQSWSIAEWTNALCGEAGEAANVAKKLLRFRDGVAGNRAIDDEIRLRAKLLRELGDVVIYADLIASRIGETLETAVTLAFNEKSEELGVEEKL